MIKRNPRTPEACSAPEAVCFVWVEIDEAEKHAMLAVSVAPAGAHELLAKIALARHDRQAALPGSEAGAGCGPNAADAPLRRGPASLQRRPLRGGPAVLLRARQQLEGRTLQMNDLELLHR